MADRKLFVSYRRASWSFTYWLVEELHKLLKAEIFVDYTSIDESNFESSLLRHLRESDAVLLIVSEYTFDPTRINQDKDWVRREISEALVLKKPIVMACQNGEFPPTDLPDDIQAIRKVQGIEFYPRYFKAGVQELAAFLDKATPIKLQQPATPPPSLPDEPPDYRAILEEAIHLHEVGQYDQAIERYNWLIAEQYQPRLISIPELLGKAISERQAEQRRWEAGELYDEIAALSRIDPIRGAKEYAKFRGEHPDFNEDPAGLSHLRTRIDVPTAQLAVPKKVGKLQTTAEPQHPPPRKTDPRLPVLRLPRVRPRLLVISGAGLLVLLLAGLLILVRPTTPVINNFSASALSILEGDTVTFSWAVADASEVAFQVDGSQPTSLDPTLHSISQVVTGVGQHTLTLIARNANGTAQRDLVLTVTRAIKIDTFTVKPNPLLRYVAQDVVIQWKADGAANVYFLGIEKLTGSPDNNAYPSTGQIRLAGSPLDTFQMTLVASASDGKQISQEVQVEVIASECYVTSDQAELRRWPGDNYPVVATLSKGIKVHPDGRDQTASWIRLTDTVAMLGSSPSPSPSNVPRTPDSVVAPEMQRWLAASAIACDGFSPMNLLTIH